MTTHIALLRGINLGRNKRVAMADLRALLDGLGYTGVRTHLQSGNALFDTRKRSATAIEREIEQRIADELGLDVRVLVRTVAELRTVVEKNPLAGVADNGSRLIVTFLDSAPDAARLRELAPDDLGAEAYGTGKREIYAWCPGGITNSPLLKAFADKQAGQTGTTRNWNTVTKLLALTEESA